MIQGDCLCKHISGHRHSMNSLPSWCLCVFAVPCVLSPELMDHCKPYHVALLLFKDDSPTHKRLCKEHRRASGVSIRASHCFPVLGSSHSTVSEIMYFWGLGWAPGIADNFSLQLLLAAVLQRGWQFGWGGRMNLPCGTAVPSCRPNHTH